jgi:hypothetical protein
MAEMKEGCVKPAAGPIAPARKSEGESTYAPVKEVEKMRPLVGQPAPDFEANAFVADAGFKPIKLSDYKGKWIVICFYPGDFTFV